MREQMPSPHPEMPSISPVSLRTLLLALQRGSLGRLGQVRLSADAFELLDHESPARRRLQRHLETLAGELAEEPLGGRRLEGIGMIGQRVVRRARVIRDPATAELEPGDILVC